MESLSSYAKRFVAQVAKPDVDFVFGLSPVISIEQKTLASNPRSTVGTMTDIASYLNLLFATIGEPHCPRTGEPTPSRIVEPDPRSDPVAARRHRDRAARAGVQGLRRGARLRLHRGPQEGLPPADRRRQAASTSPTERRRSTSCSTSRDMDAVVDRFVVGRKHEKAIKAGIASTLLVGDGLLQVHVVKGASKAEAERFYRGLCSATHHFVYGDIGPEYFMFNNPESACRTCGGLGVDKLTHPELLVPDPQRSILRRLLRPRGVQVQPGHLGRADDVQPRRRRSDFSLDTPWKDLPEAARAGDPLRHRAARKIVLRRRPTRRSSATTEEGTRGRLRRHRPAHRALLPPLPAARRGQLADGGVARQGDGRAHLPRLQRRARARDAAALHHRRQDASTTSASSTSTSCTPSSARSSRRAAAPTPAGRCSRRSAAGSSCCSASASTI